jgi:hypothetical protein
MALRDVGYSGITVIFAIVLVSFYYVALNDLVTVTLYSLMLAAGVPVATADTILMFWVYFPGAFLFALVLWSIYTATIGSGTTYEE